MVACACRMHGVAIEEGTSRAEEYRRSKKFTEAVVQRHFYSKDGLENELVDACIIDPRTKVSLSAPLLQHMCCACVRCT